MIAPGPGRIFRDVRQIELDPPIVVSVPIREENRHRSVRTDDELVVVAVEARGPSSGRRDA